MKTNNELLLGIFHSMTKTSGITDPDEYGITPLDRWGTQLGLIGGGAIGLGGSMALLNKSLMSGKIPIPLAAGLVTLGMFGGGAGGAALGTAARKQWGDPAGHHVLYEGGLGRYAKSLGKKTYQLKPDDVRQAVENARQYQKEYGKFPSSEDNMRYIYGKDSSKVTAQEWADFESDSPYDKAIAKGIDKIV